ncbi:MAG: hypothetical protein ACE5GW_08095 [Planctomycetota bacterium]
MSTTVAILKALRAIYLLVLLLAALTFLVPGLGLEDALSLRLGPAALLRAGVGLALLACLIEHLRISALKKRQAFLAQGLLRVSPELRKREAIKILIRALDSDNESVVENAHRELKRLTQMDFGPDSRQWHRWLNARDEGQG